MNARFVCLAVVLLTAAACGEDGPTSPRDDVAGSYALFAVGDQMVPSTFSDENSETTFVEGTLELREEGTWSDMVVRTVVDVDTDVEVTDTLRASGTYTIDEDANVLVMDAGDPRFYDPTFAQREGDVVGYLRGEEYFQFTR